MKQVTVFDYQQEEIIGDYKKIINTISDNIYKGHTYGNECWLIFNVQRNEFSKTKHCDYEIKTTNEFKNLKDICNHFLQPYEKETLLTAFDIGMLNCGYGDELIKIKFKVGKFIMKHISFVQTKKCDCCNGTGRILV